MNSKPFEAEEEERKIDGAKRDQVENGDSKSRKGVSHRFHGVSAPASHNVAGKSANRETILGRRKRRHEERRKKEKNCVENRRFSLLIDEPVDRAHSVSRKRGAPASFDVSARLPEKLCSGNCGLTAVARGET